MRRFTNMVAARRPHLTLWHVGCARAGGAAAWAGVAGGGGAAQRLPGPGGARVAGLGGGGVVGGRGGGGACLAGSCGGSRGRPAWGDRVAGSVRLASGTSG